MAQGRTLFTSGAPWESAVGYSRAVRAGNIIEISGTTAVENGVVVGEGNVYEQAVFIFKLISRILNDAGSGLQDVVRTRMYVTDMDQWEEVAKAHLLFFKDIRPATSMIEVNRLIDKRLLIEIEVSAAIAEKDVR